MKIWRQIHYFPCPAFGRASFALCFHRMQSQPNLCARMQMGKRRNVSQMIWSAMLSEQHRHHNSDNSHIMYSVCGGRSCRTFLMGDRSSSAQETLSPLPVILCVSWHQKWAPWATIGIRSAWEFNVDVSVWIICTSGMWFIYLYLYIDDINHTTRWFLNVLL